MDFSYGYFPQKVDYNTTFSWWEMNNNHLIKSTIDRLDQLKLKKVNLKPNFRIGPSFDVVQLLDAWEKMETSISRVNNQAFISSVSHICIVFNPDFMHGIFKKEDFQCALYTLLIGLENKEFSFSFRCLGEQSLGSQLCKQSYSHMGFS